MAGARTVNNKREGNCVGNCKTKTYTLIVNDKEFAMRN